MSEGRVQLGVGMPTPISAMESSLVDLRSDTVTRPTSSMREAMATASVGDDGWGDDFTTKELEAYAASVFNKEAGLFVPTGIMANLICVLCHCRERGSEAIVGNKSHICLYEQGGIATVGGVHPRQLANNPDGTIDLDDIEAAIRSDDPHFPRTKLICLENTHNHMGGRVLPPMYVKSVGKLAKSHGVRLHIDGARIMNAAMALGVTPARLTEHADTVSCCLSKGLGAPVGSMVLGTQAFIAEARRMRKALGGQMRQVGVLAAPGLVALKEMFSRLKEDHRYARYLAESLATIPSIGVDLQAVETNILVVDVGALADSSEVVSALETEGVLTSPWGPTKIRMVTHHHIGLKEVERTISAFKDVVAQLVQASEREIPQLESRLNHIYSRGAYAAKKQALVEGGACTSSQEYDPDPGARGEGRQAGRAGHVAAKRSFGPQVEYNPEEPTGGYLSPTMASAGVPYSPDTAPKKAKWECPGASAYHDGKTPPWTEAQYDPEAS